MNTSLKSIIRCPFCGGSYAESDFKVVEDQNGYGLLNCYCGTIPVVAGIPIMGIGLATSKNISLQHLINLIEQSKFEQALFDLIVPRPPEYPSLAHSMLKHLPEIKGFRKIKKISHNVNKNIWRENVQELLLHPPVNVKARDFFDIHFLKSGSGWTEAYYYFTYRFGQPRHLAALAFASLIEDPKGPVLDVGSGFGHVTWHLLTRAGNQPVIGVDNDFFALYVAKKNIAPDAHYICCDVNFGLPFQDNVFSFVFFADSFHYIKNKDVSIYESKRVIFPDGAVLVTSSRNRLIANPYIGYAIPPNGYTELLKKNNYCILSNDSVIDRYIDKFKPDTSVSTPLEELKSKTLLSFVISDNTEYYRDHGKLESWPHAGGRLTLNPLYEIYKNGGTDLVYLKRKFPTSFYEEDHPEYKRYLPESVMIPSSILSDLPDVENVPEYEDLLRRCVLIGVPDNY